MTELRHMTEMECSAVWNFGTNGKQFLNALSDARVNQIARSYGCTPLAVWLLDAVFSGLLHPPGFKCYPTAQAPRQADEEDWQQLPGWVANLVKCLKEEGSEEAVVSDRRVDVMEAVCIVSLGGAAKTHLLEHFYRLVDGLQAPQALRVNGQSPMQRCVGNFSSLAIKAKRHQKIVYCPDEWGMAVHPARGAAAKGTSSQQMMTMQAGKFAN